ncbi:phage tail tube protein [Phyllobacterium sp. 0TCS1.6C]|uniref:phage tail tube protein n=1 Tax=unclassified Phyllobacterium TaxID=2638441 RepID=UPI002263D5DC|nr:MULTISPECIES: phage tail tube protein [unclassified Phyllobacterium]MCX8282481.1 phage tail tube protein [Phyllobacterium sp. 0TCS1.6C]MCX8292573.1 phage tail tube protein [Phyllobacterium sp. 0TCS1.6A]
MAITTATGAKYFIGGTTAIDYTTDATAIADFEALTWVEVKEVEDGGEFGDESSDVTFQSLGDGRVRHLKGARDAGTIALVVGDDPLDPGQIAMRAAEKTKFQYNFKVEYEDAPSAQYENSVDYFRGLVMSGRKNVGTGDNVLRRTFNIGISTEILTVDTALITP